MSTNYYVETQGSPCKCCGATVRKNYHLGTSSAGWTFALSIVRDISSGLSIETLAGWLRLLEDPRARITDEYGSVVGLAEMISTITCRYRNMTNLETSRTDWLKNNNAIEGPAGLARRKIDGTLCYSHGQGTWDMCEPEGVE